MVEEQKLLERITVNGQFFGGKLINLVAAGGRAYFRDVVAGG